MSRLSTFTTRALSAQFLTPTLVLLATLAVGGVWGDSYFWEGNGAWFTAENWRNSSVPAADATGHTVEMQNYGAASTVTATISSDFTIGSWWIAGGNFGADNQLTIRQTAGTVTVKENMAMGTFDNSGALYEIAGGTYAPIVKTIVGRNKQGVSKLLVNGGTAALDGDLMLGQDANATGICSVASGSLTVGVTDVKWTGIGLAGYGELNVSGGSATFNGNLIVAYGAGEGVVNVSGGMLTVSGDSSLGFGNYWGTGGKGTVNLSGGTLTVPSIVYVAGASANNTSSADPVAALKLSGGTLKATAEGTFIPAAVTTTVSGSAILDANGKNITIAATVGGTGTLRIVGGGSVDFTTAPTCTVVADADTTVTGAGNVASTEAVTIVAPSADWASKTLPTSAGVKTVASGNWAAYADGGDAYKQTLGSDTAYVSIVNVEDSASGVEISGVANFPTATRSESDIDIYTIVKSGTPSRVNGAYVTSASQVTLSSGSVLTQIKGDAKPGFVCGAGSLTDDSAHTCAITGGSVGVVVEGDAKVQGSIVGGWYIYGGHTGSKDNTLYAYGNINKNGSEGGNSYVLIKNVQNETTQPIGSAAAGFVVGGSLVNSRYPSAKTYGNTGVAVDISNGISGTFNKLIVGGHAAVPNSAGSDANNYKTFV